MKTRFFAALVITTLFLAGIGSSVVKNGSAQGVTSVAAPPSDWHRAEQGFLSDHVQLTFSDRFIKAGECYFSPDDRKIIFQAVEQPAAGAKADEFYAMYVADVKREGGNIVGLDKIKRLSPKGSSNTCGWFHPTEPNVVIFATTIGPPSEKQAPQFQGVSSDRYKWPFPKEMRIVRCDLTQADGTAATLQDFGGYEGAYQAEGSLSSDGRHLLYCSLESGDGDLFVLDMKTKKKARVVQSHGYDGGPFFSPDGKRICYRSDRLGDKLMQLYVADLAFNESGEVVGIEREYQLTDEACVNWCPFWTPDGRRLVYSSSTLGEMNFEIYMCDADPGNLPGSHSTIKYGTAKRRITFFEPVGAVPASDVLPALSHDGKWMMWASRRGTDGGVHLWAARFVLDPDAPWKPSPTNIPPPKKQREDPKQITITDPETERIYIYDPETHKLSEYHMDTHTLTEITDSTIMKRVAELYEAQKNEPQ